jgi:hypothetical protein
LRWCEWRWRCAVIVMALNSSVICFLTWSVWKCLVTKVCNQKFSTCK